LVTLIGIFIGMVITIQFAYGLKAYGALDKVPKLMSLAMIRELGPGFIGLLVGGKIGSGFTPEIASMKVTEQIDAIRALGDDPIGRLLVPRVTAVLSILPFLTLWMVLSSFIGGAFVASLEYHLDPEVFFKLIKLSVKNHEIIHMLIKSLVFGYLIAIIGTANGFRAEYDTESVGEFTTLTVESIFIFVLISDFFLSKFFTIIKLTWFDIL